MKVIVLSLCAFFSFNAFSAEAYDCNFGGSHFFLKISDDSKITLENKFQKFPCEKATVYLPGTEIDMPVLKCAGRFKTVTYYMTQLDEETIILSTNIVFSQDVTCKKI